MLKPILDEADKDIISTLIVNPGGIWLNKLASEINTLSRVTLIKRVNKLVKLGLLEVERDPNHKQKKIFKLNEKFRRVILTVKEMFENEKEFIANICKEASLKKKSPVELAPIIIKRIEATVSNILFLAIIEAKGNALLLYYITYMISDGVHSLVKRIFDAFKVNPELEREMKAMIKERLSNIQF